MANKVKKLLLVLVLAVILISSTMTVGLAVKENIKYISHTSKLVKLAGKQMPQQTQQSSKVYKLLHVGESIVIDGKKIVLKNVGSAETNTPIIVDVDGVIKVVTGTEIVNGVEITVWATHWEEDINERSALMILKSV